MARIATALVTLVLAAPAAAEEAAHPDQFLESGTVPAHTSADHPFTTTHPLVQGRYYRLVLTGTWELQWPATQFDPAFEQDVDAFFCRTECSSDPAGARLWYGVGVRLGTTEDSAKYHCCDAFHAIDYRGGPTPNSTYESTFYVSDYGGAISFWDPYEGHYGDPDSPTGATGSFGFQLYGMKQDYGGGEGTSGGKLGGTWHIGPVTFAVPSGGKSFTGRTYRFAVQSTSDATVYEKLTAYVGSRAYAAGKGSGVLYAGRRYTLPLTVPQRPFKAIVAGYKAGKKVVLRSTFTVVSGGGRVTRSIDVRLY